MRAHTVPVSYLANFSAETHSKKRYRKLVGVARDRTFAAAIDKLCVTTNYYTASSAEDAALFEEHENAFGAVLAELSTGTADLPRFHAHIWALKLRNPWMLDGTAHRAAVFDSLRSLDVGARKLHVFRTESDLITSDDPVLVINHGMVDTVASQLLLLPIAPRMLMASVPADRWLHPSTSVSDEDVTTLNRAQARQARRHVLMREARSDILTFQQLLGERPSHITRGALDHRDARARLRLDYPTWNPVELPFRFLTRCIGTAITKSWWTSMFADRV